MTSPLSTKMPDEIKALNKMDFVVYYYGYDSFLFSIDALFYQIVIKMMVYLKNKVSKQQENKKLVPNFDFDHQDQKNIKMNLIKHSYLEIEKILNERLRIICKNVI